MVSSTFNFERSDNFAHDQQLIDNYFDSFKINSKVTVITSETLENILSILEESFPKVLFSLGNNFFNYFFKVSSIHEKHLSRLKKLEWSAENAQNFNQATVIQIFASHFLKIKYMGYKFNDSFWITYNYVRRTSHNYVSWLAFNNCHILLKALLKAGSNINHELQFYKKSPLKWAMENPLDDFSSNTRDIRSRDYKIIRDKKIQCVKILIQNGANVNAKSYNSDLGIQTTALWDAAYSCDSAMIRILVESKAEINGKIDYVLASPLQATVYSTIKNYYSIKHVKTILELKGDVFSISLARLEMSHSPCQYEVKKLLQKIHYYWPAVCLSVYFPKEINEIVLCYLDMKFNKQVFIEIEDDFFNKLK